TNVGMPRAAGGRPVAACGVVVRVFCEERGVLVMFPTPVMPAITFKPQPRWAPCPKFLGCFVGGSTSSDEGRLRVAPSTAGGRAQSDALGGSASLAPRPDIKGPGDGGEPSAKSIRSLAICSSPSSAPT